MLCINKSLMVCDNMFTDQNTVTSAHLLIIYMLCMCFNTIILIDTLNDEYSLKCKMCIVHKYIQKFQ